MSAGIALYGIPLDTNINSVQILALFLFTYSVYIKKNIENVHCSLYIVQWLIYKHTIESTIHPDLAFNIDLAKLDIYNLKE